MRDLKREEKKFTEFVKGRKNKLEEGRVIEVAKLELE